MQEYTITLKGVLTVGEDNTDDEYETILLNGKSLDEWLLEGLPLTMDRMYKDGYDNVKLYGETVFTIKINGRPHSAEYFKRIRRYTFKKEGFPAWYEVEAENLDVARVKLSHKSNILTVIAWAVTANPVKIECLYLTDTGLYKWTDTGEVK